MPLKLAKENLLIPQKENSSPTLGQQKMPDHIIFRSTRPKAGAKRVTLFQLAARIRSISSQKVFLRAVECGSWVAFGYIGQARATRAAAATQCWDDAMP
jgi:hypothetical protein